MALEMENVCRTCAGASGTLMPIFGSDGVDKQLPEKINKHLPISVHENDLLPTKICSRCIFSLEASIEFHTICAKADKTFKGLLGTQEDADPLQLDIPQDIDAGFTTVSSPENSKTISHNTSLDTPPWTKEVNHICGTCNTVFSCQKDLLFHNQQMHQPQTSLVIPSMESIFYNEVEITKKRKSSPMKINQPTIRIKQPITKILPKPVDSALKTSPRPAMTIIRPLAPKTARAEKPLVIKPSTSMAQKSSLEQIMTSQPLRAPSKQKLPGKKLNIPGVPISNTELEHTGPMQDLGNKPIIIPPFHGRAEDAMDVEVFVPKIPLFDLGNVEETLPIHVNISEENYFTCERCQTSFRSKALLKDHIIRKYIITDPADFQFTCEECGKKFPTGYSLKAHLRNKKARLTKIICEVCNTQTSRKDWGSHFAMHNNHDKFNCHICDKKFGTQQLLRQHSTVHANLRFMCDLCDVSFNRRANLQLHRKIHLASAELAESLRCDICNYQSNDRYYMMHHHKVHFSTELNAYLCPITTCNASFEDFQTLREHCGTHTRDELNMYTKRKKRVQRCGKNQIPPYLCTLCKSDFVRPMEYSSHISQDHGVELMAGEAIFTCNHCLECFGSLLDLNEHIERHPEAHKYPCTKCNLTFAVFNNRNHHLATVHSTKFECEICNMSFMTVFKLKEHMPSHSDIKPFICTTCGKGFKRKRTLGEHQKVHSDLKKFVCEHCNAKFRWKGDLVRHATRHTGINLYHCSECEFSSNKRKEVEAHISENHSVIVDMQV